MITLENVSRSYGRLLAVDNISFSVNPGEVFGFLGVNGAGKTTTLRMITGILRPSQGRIQIAGYDIEQDPEKAKAVTGYIPDRPYIYTKLTAREFLEFVGDLYSVPRSIRDQRREELLQEYGLLDRQNELIESFSHGMKQRLATAAALMHAPEVLVIDEPMVGLDPHGAKMLKQALRRYAQKGMTILLSTHSLNVAEEVSDRIAIIHQGKILTIGTLQELRTKANAHQESLEEVFLRLTDLTLQPEERNGVAPAP